MSFRSRGPHQLEISSSHITGQTDENFIAQLENNPIQPLQTTEPIKPRNATENVDAKVIYCFYLDASEFFNNRIFLIFRRPTQQPSQQEQNLWTLETIRTWFFLSQCPFSRDHHHNERYAEHMALTAKAQKLLLKKFKFLNFSLHVWSLHPLNCLQHLFKNNTPYPLQLWYSQRHGSFALSHGLD